MAAILKIIGRLLELLANLGLWKRAKKKAEVLEETLESVNESLEVENRVEKAQDKVDEKPSEVRDEDGGLNFDSFNRGG